MININIFKLKSNLVFLFLLTSLFLLNGHSWAKKTKPIKIKSSSILTQPGLFNLEVKSQKMNNWCFAATTEMVLNYYKINTTQCDIVKGIRTDFLNSICENNCHSIKNNSLDFPLSENEFTNWYNYFNKNGLKPSNSTFDPFKIIQSLDAGNPVIALLNTGQGENSSITKLDHAVVISGYIYSKKTNTFEFLFLDPKNDCQGCKYFMKVQKIKRNNWEFVFIANQMLTKYALPNSQILTFSK